MLERAIVAKAEDTATAARLHQDEIAATEAELKKTEAAIEALGDELEAEIHHGSEQRRKALAHAFVRLLVVEERDTIQPRFYIRGGLPPDMPGDNSEAPSDGTGFRAMTPTVGRRHSYSNLEDIRQRLTAALFGAL